MCIKNLAKANEALGIRKDPFRRKNTEKPIKATAKASKAVKLVINQVFSLYSNLLTKETRCPLKMIVDEQFACAPLMDLYGEEHPKKREQSLGSFMECITIHLLTMFSNDAAETEHFYTSNGL